MRVTPRSEEVARVKAVLEAAQGEDSPYADLDELAKALLKAAAEALDMRETYVTTVTWDTIEGVPAGMVYGPFGSRGDAVKFGDNLAGSGGVRNVHAMIGPGIVEARWDGKLWPGNCKCSHVKDMHRMDGSAYGQCGLDGCSCKKFTAITVKAKPRAKKTTTKKQEGIS